MKTKHAHYTRLRDKIDAPIRDIEIRAMWDGLTYTDMKYKEKIDVIKHNLYLVQGDLTAYKSDVNEMLLATSDRVTEYVEQMDVVKSEIYTSMLSTAQATSSRIDSLLADLKSMKNIFKSVLEEDSKRVKAN